MNENIFITTVGSNPLPIYVTMKLFLHAERQDESYVSELTDGKYCMEKLTIDKYILIASSADEQIGGITVNYAENVKKCLGEEFGNEIMERIIIEMVHKDDIHNKIKIIDKVNQMNELICNAENVWILFSGGTKAMATFVTEQVVRLRNNKQTFIMDLDSDKKVIRQTTALMSDDQKAIIQIGLEACIPHISLNELTNLWSFGKEDIDRINKIIGLYGLNIGKKEESTGYNEAISNCLIKMERNKKFNFAFVRDVGLKSENITITNIHAIVMDGYEINIFKFEKLKINKMASDDKEFVNNKKKLKLKLMKDMFLVKELGGMHAKLIYVIYSEADDGIENVDMERAKKIINSEVDSFETGINLKLYDDKEFAQLVNSDFII